MRTLYFECNMGAAGDMLLAALLELHPTPEDFLKRLNTIGVPHVTVTAERVAKCGITGTHVTVKVRGHEEGHDDHRHDHDHGNEHEHEHDHNHDDHHTHGSYHEIEHLLAHLNISETVKANALGVYKQIAEAESRAHGLPVDQIHFHEVGELDAVADIIGVCMLLEDLAPTCILASSIHVGSGQVRCAHGVLPVPAPATADILRDVPIYGGAIRGELCTPTGAALLKHFVERFVPMPPLKVSKIGYGMGKKDFEQANCVRAFLGETEGETEEVLELSCNLDDMTGEALAFAQELLLDEGALDVYTIPLGMKKGRAGTLFTCMCKHDTRDALVSLIFKHTSTLGIRETLSRRYTLNRNLETVQTPYGSVRIKAAEGYGVTKSKPEYEDIAKIAKENNISLVQVVEALQILP